jgi:hypothetical protein
MSRAALEMGGAEGQCVVRSTNSFAIAFLGQVEKLPGQKGVESRATKAAANKRIFVSVS